MIWWVEAILIVLGVFFTVFVVVIKFDQWIQDQENERERRERMHELYIVHSENIEQYVQP